MFLTKIIAVYLEGEKKKESDKRRTFYEVLVKIIVLLFLKVQHIISLLVLFKYSSISRGYNELSSILIIKAARMARDVEVKYVSQSLPPQVKSSDDEYFFTEPMVLSDSLSNVIKNRKSTIPVNSSQLSIENMSTLMFNACGCLEDGRRAFPTGGAILSSKIFLVVFTSNDTLCSGVYKYNSNNHSLIPVVIDSGDLSTLFEATSSLSVVPGALVLITHEFHKNEGLYGEFGYRLALLEAGHIGQNIYLSCSAMNLACVALGIANFNLKKMNSALGIDGVEEAVVHAVALANP
ncbi:SagB/ThcOx family dehydrogenase [Motilimonas sp. E26]|uniref:SagB/ThcOx family dehydrogenase n=1 Tax=Motilimonas sp. E26 TaxID=2865674 RepID=UPI001E399DE0|nr:SagB/ThcOx family dehydrogenase [Motilimonas sp. E26]MCE0558328.1 SagB/ThcOx family dehydrogenase [Motilimonas sp. E26]